MPCGLLPGAAYNMVSPRVRRERGRGGEGRWEREKGRERLYTTFVNLVFEFHTVITV